LGNIDIIKVGSMKLLVWPNTVKLKKSWLSIGRCMERELWVRPFDMFTEGVMVGGKLVKRFEVFD